MKALQVNFTLKVVQSYFSKFTSGFHLKNHHTKDVKFQISVETVKPFGFMKQFCILQLPISYCVSLIIVPITRQVSTNIFQPEHFSAVKFAMGCEKNMSFLVIGKSPKVWKKVEKIGLGSFKVALLPY